jgi:hypothetical protein
MFRSDRCPAFGRLRRSFLAKATTSGRKSLWLLRPPHLSPAAILRSRVALSLATSEVFPSRPPQPKAGDERDVETGLCDDLPQALETVTRLGLKKMAQILRTPLDVTDGNLTRSQVTAAIGAVNAQLRADEQQLRRKRTGDVLERLLKVIEKQKKIIEQEKKKLPPSSSLEVPPAVQQPEQVELEPSEGSWEG